jgi:hypothetical protein
LQAFVFYGIGGCVTHLCGWNNDELYGSVEEVRGIIIIAKMILRKKVDAICYKQSFAKLIVIQCSCLFKSFKSFGPIKFDFLKFTFVYTEEAYSIVFIKKIIPSKIVAAKICADNVLEDAIVNIFYFKGAVRV